MKHLHVVVDTQFGSTGKGLLAGYLAKSLCPDTILTAWGPNAGHTFIDTDGSKYINIAIPNGIVGQDRLKRLMFGPGSIINPEIMLAEMERYHALVGHLDLLIHHHACVVTKEHRAAEAQYGFGIGSTMKGVGEAQIQKLQRRVGPGSNIAAEALKGTALEGCLVNNEEWDFAIDDTEVAIIEGAQGFSLSLNQGFYPYVTSRDCTTHQLLSDCALPLAGSDGTSVNSYSMDVYGVARTYPIRVANRFKGGQMVGTSGPCYFDQEEIQWQEIGLEPELTTVTKLPRRVFTFSDEQIRRAVRMDGIDHMFLNFANYDQTRNGRSIGDISEAIARAGAKVRYLGWGPALEDIQIL